MARQVTSRGHRARASSSVRSTTLDQISWSRRPVGFRRESEQGFEVVVARDATAAPRHPEWGCGYTAALINFRFLAHAVLSTDEVVMAMSRALTSSR